MIRNVYKQLWNRRRSNGWIVIELLLVFCLTWYIADFLFEFGFNSALKNYRDLNATWEVKVGELPADHPEYNAGESDAESRYENFLRILTLLKEHPQVEALGICFGNSAPGKGDNWSRTVMTPDSALRVHGQQLLIEPRYDYLSVFRQTKEKGKVRVRTTDFNWDRTEGIVVSERVRDRLVPEGTIEGRKMLYWDDDSDRFREVTILGVVDNTKRYAYNRPQAVMYVPMKLEADNLKYAEVLIRNKSGVSPMVFKDSFAQEMVQVVRVGNFYFSHLLYIPNIEAATNRSFGVDNALFTQIALMLFLLVSVLLCLIGTFWYRVNVRRGEIGLRMALGSTRRGIMKILWLEGLALLTLVVVPAMLFEFQLVKLDLTQVNMMRYRNPQFMVDNLYIRFLITNLLTFGVLLVIISLAVWLPAWKAAGTAPADVLHEE